jgi:trimeric autotransporter adhesin
MRSRAVSVLVVSGFILFTGCGGRSGSPGGTSTPPATPQSATIASISPSSVQAGAASLTLQVSGSNFVSGSVVTFNGNNLVTTYASGTSLSAALPASSVTNGASVKIAVDNPGAADSATVTFEVDSPTPVLAAVMPASTVVGNSGTFTLTGSGFESNSAVLLNGSAVPTTSISATSLTVNLTAAQLAQAGTAQLSVMNPAPQGGTSAAVNLQITQPIPVLESLSPASVLAGSPALVLTLTGSSFSPTAEVTANSTALTVSTQTPTSITATLPASAVAEAGAMTVMVTNPGVNAESSGAQSISVVATPALIQAYPAGAAIGGPDLSVKVFGSGFSPTSAVEWNGTALNTAYQSSEELTAIIPTADLARFSNASIMVSTPVDYPASKKGAATSSSQVFSTYLGLPNNDLLYNPKDGLLYASLPGSLPGTLGNTVVAIDPITGNLVRQIAVGSEPGKMAISDDGTQLFVGLNGAASIRQVDLTSGQAGKQFSLGPLGPPGFPVPPTTVESMAAVPGEPDSVAVFDNNGVITIFDSGIPRAKSSAGLAIVGYLDQSTGSISFGSSGSTLYVSSYLGGLFVFTVDSTGVTSFKTISTSINAGSQIQYDGGRLYLSNGTVLDANTGKQLGAFLASTGLGAPGPIVSDPALGLAFIGYGSRTDTFPQVLAFDESSFAAAGNLSMSNVDEFNPPPGFQNIVRWGQDGLALDTATQIYVDQSSIVKDLTGSPADLAVTLSAPATATTGGTVSLTATITNKGPGQAQGITYTSTLPDSLILQAVKPSQGSCAIGNEASCNLASLASGSSATVMVTATATTAGSFESTAIVSSVSFDPVQSNNESTATMAVTGSLYSAVPVVFGVAPALVQAGSSNFTLTVTGSGFNASSTIQIGGNAQPTIFVSDTELAAHVDGSAVATYGWTPVNVSNPSPGGGISQVVPLTIYALVNVPANAISFDPFTRKIYATVPSSATSVTGNSLVAVDPTSGSLGAAAVVGSEPNVMAETADGNYLYIGIDGTNSLGKFNLVSRTLDATIPLSLPQYQLASFAAGDMATMPGTDTTLAITTAVSGHLGIFDVSGNSGAFRSNLAAGGYSVFPDAAHLYTFDGNFNRYAVDATGITLIDSTSTLGSLGLGPYSFVLANGSVYLNGGGIVNPSATPPSRIASLNTFGLFGLSVAPDAATSKDFLVIENAAGSFGYYLYRYNTTQYIAEAQLILPTAPDGSELGYNVLRWGQDGLALRSYGSFGGKSTSQILLIRGPFVLPSELQANPAPVLAGSSQTTIAVNSGNTTLTLSGSNFMPGAVALWNGAPLSTTFTDPSHLSVAIAASDVASPGPKLVIVQNPGSPNSAAVTITVN